MSELLTMNKHGSQSLLLQFVLRMPSIIWLDLNHNWSLPAINNILESVKSNSNLLTFKNKPINQFWIAQLW